MNPIFGAIFEGLKTIAGPVTEWVKGKAELRKAKAEGEIAITKARTKAVIDQAASAQDHVQNWEITSAQNAGWKDEWFVILFSIPLIMCFVPGLVEYVEAGFAALNNCPEWYRWALCIMVAASFGYRKFADFMGKKAQ